MASTLWDVRGDRLVSLPAERLLQAGAGPTGGAACRRDRPMPDAERGGQLLLSPAPGRSLTIERSANNPTVQQRVFHHTRQCAEGMGKLGTERRPTLQQRVNHHWLRRV